MTEKKMTTEELMEYYFGPADNATPDQPHAKAVQAAHDYACRNIGPSVGTIADRLEAAFLAGTQWALTHYPADNPTPVIELEARTSRAATCDSMHDGWVCTREKGHSGRHVASAFALWGTAYDVWEEE